MGEKEYLELSRQVEENFQRIRRLEKLILLAIVTNLPQLVKIILAL